MLLPTLLPVALVALIGIIAFYAVYRVGISEILLTKDQARRIAADAKLPELPDKRGCNDGQNIAICFDSSDCHCLCRLHLWDGSRLFSFTATVGHNQSGQPATALGGQ